MRRVAGLCLVLLLCLGSLPLTSSYAAQPRPQRTIAELPWRELWAEITFNGQPAGYGHCRLSQLEGGLWLARSEAVLCVSGGKEMAVRSETVLAPDASLRRTVEETVLDGSTVRAVAEVKGGVLAAEYHQAGRTVRQSLPLEGRKVYTEVAMDLIPWLAGLSVGAEHHFLIFDYHERRLIECRQRVAALERAEGFAEEAVRIETNYAGMKTTSWLSLAGRPLRGQMMGVFVARTVDEGRALASLAAARGVKRDALGEYVLVKAGSIPCSQLRRLVIELSGLPDDFRPLSDHHQRVQAKKVGGKLAAIYTIDAQAAPRPEPALDLKPYLAPSRYAESADPEIVALCREVVGQAKGVEAVERVVRWVQGRLRPSGKDCVSALDALRAGEGDCQAHAYLATALMRAAGVPCRVVSGLCYSAAEGGFLYHAWCEAYVGGWLAVDPVMGAPAGASHIKLIEGEELESVALLTDLMGRIKARVLEFACLEAPSL